MNDSFFPPEFRRISSNLTQIVFGSLKIWFSYDTVIAFQTPLVNQGKIVASVNQWSFTTGRHLNEIEPDHKKRFTPEIFNELLQEVYNKLSTKG